MSLKDTFLDEVLQAFIGKVDAELIKGVGATGHVLWSGEVEKANECVKVFTAQPLVNMLVQPCEEKRIQRFCEVISVIRCTIGVKEDGAELLLYKLSLVGHCALQSTRLDTQEFGNNAKDICVTHDSSVNVTTTVNGELKIAEVENGSEKLASLSDVSLGQANCLESDLELLKAVGVIIPNTDLACWDSTTLTEITVLGFIQEVEVLALFLSCTCHEVVEDVEVALSGWHGRYAVALEVIVESLNTGEAPTVSELQLCVFSEARSIRVEQSAGVTKGLDDKLCGW